MAGDSRQRMLGRLITALGLVWILWSIFTGSGLIDLELADELVGLPILPGIVLLFIGRLIGRGQRRAEEPEAEEHASASPATTRRPAPQRPTPTRVLEIESRPEPEAEAVVEAMENMGEEIAEAIGQTGKRKTSAEMVAEARERFGRRGR